VLAKLGTGSVEPALQVRDLDSKHRRRFLCGQTFHVSENERLTVAFGQRQNGNLKQLAQLSGVRDILR
jgi:hypothetical protein